MSEFPTVFVSAYRNFSIRYILYSGILDQLKKQKVRIVVFVKDNDVEYYRRHLGGENIIFEPVLFEKAHRQLKSNQLGNLFVLIRKCMSGAEDGYQNTTDQVRIYQYGKELSATLQGRIKFQLVKALAMLGKKVRAVRKGLVRIESSLFPGKLYDRYFDEYSPQMLIVSSLGYMIDPFLMRAAKRRRCRVISIVHSWDNPTTKDYRGAEPDHVITWNEIMKREVNVFHDLPNDRISVGGIAHWDFYFNGSFKPRSKEEFLDSNSLTRDRKLIFYATSNFVLFRRTFDVIEQLLSLMENGSLGFSSQLLVRLHPGYLLRERGRDGQVIDRYKARMDALKERYGALVQFTLPMMTVLNDDIDMPPEDMYYLAETLYHSDVVLTEYSTLMIEASIFDVPVINVGLYNFRDTEKPASFLENYTHIKRVLKPGASRNAYSMEDLKKYIEEYLGDRSIDRDKRKRLVDQEITTNRGCASTVIGNMLVRLVAADRPTS